MWSTRLVANLRLRSSNSPSCSPERISRDRYRAPPRRTCDPFSIPDVHHAREFRRSVHPLPFPIAVASDFRTTCSKLRNASEHGMWDREHIIGCRSVDRATGDLT